MVFWGEKNSYHLCKDKSSSSDIKNSSSNLQERSSFLESKKSENTELSEEEVSLPASKFENFAKI